MEGRRSMPTDQPTSSVDPITELLNLRAWVLRISYEVDAIGDLPARKRGPEANRIADRMRAKVNTPRMVEACRR
jgi:hypothetical protein